MAINHYGGLSLERFIQVDGVNLLAFADSWSTAEGVRATNPGEHSSVAGEVESRCRREMRWAPR